MERFGVGDSVRPGLRDARRLESRLEDRPADGAGDAVRSRREKPGRVDEGRDKELDNLRNAEGLGEGR